MIHQFPGIPNASLARPLTPEEKRVLQQWNLPSDRPHFDVDLKASTPPLFRNSGHRKRLERKGLPVGRWHGGRRFLYAIETAQYLLSLSSTPPPFMAERSAKGLKARGQARDRVVPPAAEKPTRPSRKKVPSRAAASTSRSSRSSGSTRSTSKLAIVHGDA
jgi:hypothetical protein